MAEFEINIEGDFLKLFGTMKKDLEKVTQRILRKTANETDKEIHRVVTAKGLIDITFEEFVRRAKTKTIIRHSELKGGIDGMNIVISITAKAHTSYRFSPRYIGPAKKKIWIGKINGKAQKFYNGQAFQLPGKKPLFIRSSTNRFPLKPVFGPSIPKMLEAQGLLPSILSFSEGHLRANLLKGLGEDLDI